MTQEEFVVGLFLMIEAGFQEFSLYGFLDWPDETYPVNRKPDGSWVVWVGNAHVVAETTIQMAELMWKLGHDTLPDNVDF